jgi:glyoxylase I family protein
MELIATHHVALLTENFAEMETFYTQTLGFPVTRRWDEVGNIFIDVGSTTIELCDRKNMQRPLSGQYGFHHLALHVADVDETYAELSKLGIKFNGEPKNFQDIRLVFFSDPDGNLLELVEDPRKPEKD